MFTVRLHALLLISCLVAASASGAELYVSLRGNDNNPGTKEKPLLTLEGARDKIPAMRKQNGLPAGGVTVYLRGGTYERTKSFDLGKEDSGTTKAPITYASAPGERATISGGRTLKPEWFAKVSDPEILKRIVNKEARSEIYQVDLKKHGITDYGEITRHGFNVNIGLWMDAIPPLAFSIDGKRFHRARYPNSGEEMLKMDRVLSKGPKRPREKPSRENAKAFEAFCSSGGTFSYSFDRPKLWKQEGEIWLDGVISQDWAWTYNRVASIDTKEKTVTLRHGEVYGIIKYPRNSDFFFFANVLAELDAKGEYYLDRNAGVLYLIPMTPLKPTSFISVSMLKEPMIAMKETSHLVFQDLILDGGRGNAVECTEGKSNRFAFCEIRNFESSGFSIRGEENKILSCHLHHIGSSGVYLEGGNMETLTPGNNAVENCHIHNWGVRQKVYSSAVQLKGVGNRVSYSHLHSAPHSGMVVGGNDHVIEYNEINNILMDFHDMGAIYFNLGMRPLARGTRIYRNLFHHIGENDRVNGVYPDNGTMGVLVEENIFYKFGSNKAQGVRAVGGNGFAYVAVRNNMFVDCARVYDQSYYLNSWGRKKHLPNFMKKWKELFASIDIASMPHAKKYSELLRFFDESRIFPEGNTFERNLVYNPTINRFHKGAFMTRGGPEDHHKHIKASNNWIADKDPGFVNIKTMDFTLKKDAAVLNKIQGFTPIPFKEIGLTGQVGPHSN